MPSFCRHSRLIQNCPICSKEQAIEQRPLVTSSAPRSTEPRPTGQSRNRTGSRGGGGSRATGGVKVRRLARGDDDGYRSPLVPGLKSSQEAERLAEELAFSVTRLERLAADPPGLYGEVADPAGDLEERTWLAFLIAYLSPLEDAEDPFAAIRAVRVAWSAGELPELEAVQTGPRSAHDPGRGARTLQAYRAWATRSGSQAQAFTGDGSWTPERRFARIYERLALPGLHRDARFDLLLTLGALGVYELEAGSLALGGDNRVTLAAKRALGIGDPLLLERRAGELAAACEVPLGALDLGFYNWEAGRRAHLGLEPDAEPDPDAHARAQDALGL